MILSLRLPQNWAKVAPNQGTAFRKKIRNEVSCIEQGFGCGPQRYFSFASLVRQTLSNHSRLNFIVEKVCALRI